MFDELAYHFVMYSHTYAYIAKYISNEIPLCTTGKSKLLEVVFLQVDKIKMLTKL